MSEGSRKTGAVKKIVFLVFVAFLGIAGWVAWALLMPVQPPGQTFVMLRPGYSTHRIAAELKSAGIIRSEKAFVLWHYIHPKRSLKAGEYLFEKPSNIIDLQKRLRRGDVYLHTVVVPEGYTMFDIARAIEEAGLGHADDFLKVAKSDTHLIADIAPNATSLEGYLFPDTYEFSRMMSMEEMAAAMVCQFRVVAKSIGLIPSEPGTAAVETISKRSGHLCGTISIQIKDIADPPPSIRSEERNPLERTVTMASIVEKETAVPEER